MDENQWRQHPAVKLLLEFFCKLNEWESETNRQYEAIDWESFSEAENSTQVSERKRALAGIFAEYCDVGANATRLQDQGLSHSARPQHDPEVEKIIEVREEAGTVVVETRETVGSKWFWKYEVVRTKDGWKVKDKRYRKLKPEGRWSKDIL